MFSGFGVTANAPATAVAPDGHGRSIPPELPDASSIAPGPETATAEAAPAVPIPRLRLPGSSTDWDFAE